MKITKSVLAKLIKEEVEALTINPSSEIDVEVEEEPAVSKIGEALKAYIASLRAGQLWFHAAHHLAKGTGFVGDHSELLSSIYTALDGDYDTAVEKGVSLTGDEMVACPMHVIANVMPILKRYKTPAGMNQTEILQTGLAFIKAHYELLTTIYDELEAANELPLGLDDFLASSANQYDKFVYMLQQRLKDSVG